ncbi:MAG: hypothetical protein U9N85_13560 [Bacteroidota bacterium]|nr:hypothetical protein [Bacteroidota bacterium]
MYLTVKEAIDLSGKSQTTIHRLCQHNDDSKYIKKEGNKYLIDKDFLMQKYPSETQNLKPKNLIDSDKEQSLIRSLTDKNLQITELTVENKELEKKVKELNKDVFDNQHELATNIDANLSLQKEVDAVSSINDLSADHVIDTESSNEKELLLYRTLLITGSLMVLTAFIFFMYYFTK